MNSEVIQGCTPKIGVPSARYLVYTSAGDHSVIRDWLKGEKNFNLWVTQYGDADKGLRDLAEHHNHRRGGKFPNLKDAWLRWPEVFSAYDAIFVLDDDIHLTGGEISQLFRILRRYNLTLLQPAFSPVGKISHRSTVAKLGSFGRYSDFAELGVPMFTREALEEFLQVYDPEIVGWGVDWWYMHVLKAREDRKIALIDAIACLNPDEQLAGRERAIDQLQATAVRRKLWEEKAQSLGIDMGSRSPDSFGELKALAFEDQLAMVVAPFKELRRKLTSERPLIRLKRSYWRWAKRAQKVAD